MHFGVVLSALHLSLQALEPILGVTRLPHWVAPALRLPLVLYRVLGESTTIHLLHLPTLTHVDLRLVSIGGSALQHLEVARISCHPQGLLSEPSVLEVLGSAELIEEGTLRSIVELLAVVLRGLGHAHRTNYLHAFLSWPIGTHQNNAHVLGSLVGVVGVGGVRSLGVVDLDLLQTLTGGVAHFGLLLLVETALVVSLDDFTVVHKLIGVLVRVAQHPRSTQANVAVALRQLGSSVAIHDLGVT